MSSTGFHPGKFPGTLFYNPDNNNNSTSVYLRAWEMIIGITLPDVTESISQGWYTSGWIGGNGPALKYFSAKNLKIIGDSAFRNSWYGDCSNIEYIDTPALTSIGNSALDRCANLKVIHLGAVPPAMGTYALYGTPDDGSIKVPAASVIAYKNDTSWGQYASRISEY
jgi:hypothetical protein